MKKSENHAEIPVKQLPTKLEKWLDAYYWLVEKLKAQGFKQTSTNAREGLANLTSTWVKRSVVIKWIQDELIEDGDFKVPIRIYHPQPDSHLPVLIYFHGGGHMSGSITVYDPICRRLAKETGHIVVSVDYRLAPECPYPEGITDCLTVVQNVWKPLVTRKVKYTEQLSIAGDSAGGAICATIAHACQNNTDVNIYRQVLLYPSLDYTMQLDSVTQNGEGYLLHKDQIEWFFENYFRHGEDRKSASPLYMDFSQNFPETLVITAEFCPLRDEGLAYLHRLKETGVRTDHLHLPNMIHTFLNMEDLVQDECNSVYARVNNFLHRP